MSTILSLALVASAFACPFCTTPQPTLTQRREAASVTALGEVTQIDGAKLTLRLHQILAGRDRLQDPQSLSLPTGAANLKTGSLVLLFGTPDESPDAAHSLTWEIVPVNETSYAYFARAPASRVPMHDRLIYFSRFLEHPEPLVAEDVYGEFGQAPYDAVADVADRLPMKSLRAWLVDDDVPQQRKGLYGLMLGLAKDEAERRANLEVLRQVIDEPASDFRSGFDGVLGGYLVASGATGLKYLEERLLANPQAARGDVLHAMTALRFYEEYGKAIPRERLAQALAKVLDRPEFAAPAIIDLARWQAWEQLPHVIALWGREGYREPATERAIIGFLLVCPAPEAVRELGRLRQIAPERVAEAEKAVSAGIGSR